MRDKNSTRECIARCDAHRTDLRPSISYVCLYLCACMLLLSPTGNVVAQSQNESTEPSQYIPLKHSAEQVETCLEINKNVFTRHYEKDNLGYASLAEDILDVYIDTLDYRRIIFYDSHVSQFKADYSARMSEILRDCDLKPAFAMFNLYRKLSLERYEKVLDGLDERIQNFDYTLKQQWHTNRKEAELPHPRDQKEADALWHADIKNRVLGMRLRDKTSTETISTIREQISRQQRNMRTIYSEDIFALYMNAYLQLFDTHTSYLPPARSEDFNISMRLSLDGIGAMLQQDEEHTKVVDVLAGGPASQQTDLKAGDRIIGVAQGLGEFENVIGWRLDKVISKIRGPRKSTVRLRIVDGEDVTLEHPKDISIVRDKIKLEKQAAKKDIIEIEYQGHVKRIGVVTLPSFYLDFRAQQLREQDYRSSTRDVSKLLGELEKSQPPIDGLIVDLRNNAGGSLVEANTLTGMFVEQGPSVQVKHSNGRIRRYGKSRRSRYYSKPLAVLMNRTSASASEIFGAAIQDYGRGIVIGTTSYGKGTVQSLHAMSVGQLKITDAKFYRISGASTQRRGVIPDVRYPQVYDTTVVGENVSERALDWDQIGKVRHRNFYDVASIRDELQVRHDARTVDHPEFNYLRRRAQLRAARRERDRVLSLQEATRKVNYEQDKLHQKELDAIRAVAKNTTATKEHKSDKSLSEISTPTASVAKAIVRAAKQQVDQIKKKIQKHGADKKGSSSTSEDPFLVETALVLMDSVSLLDPKQLAAAQTKADTRAPQNISEDAIDSAASPTP